MMDGSAPKNRILREAGRQFRMHFGCTPAVAAYAPGRVEVLGNHTDYNEGFVLSAALQLGACFWAAAAPDAWCRVFAANRREEARWATGQVHPLPGPGWANYVLGVFAHLMARVPESSRCRGFWGLLRGNVPLGAGLSSSAALEMAVGLALAELYALRLDALSLARIGHAAEHEFVGTRCGLLDQLSSLQGRAGCLILTDFRSYAMEHIPLPADARFILADTGVRHRLAEGEYNSRRAACEAAVRVLAAVLPHPVSALRDVRRAELEAHADCLDPVTARRAAHVVEENERVWAARDCLRNGDLESFGRLMFASHQSSRTQFENSCAELDTLVEWAARTPGVLGARLSGGGFGGSVILLVRAADTDRVVQALDAFCAQQFGKSLPTRLVIPSDGAERVPVSAFA